MFIDVDPTHRRVYGRAKQGAEHGRLKGQRTLHPILATLSTPLARPVIGAVRLRRGKAADVRGAKSFVAQALNIAKEAGGTGIRMVRADSKFYTADVVAACRTAGAHFSLTTGTTGMNPAIAAAIGRIEEDAWIPIRYPDAFVDPDTGETVSDAEVAEITYTAFTGRKKSEQETARLIVRRVRRLNPHAASGQGELFDSWRYHPIFTDSPFSMLEAELHHRADRAPRRPHRPWATPPTTTPRPPNRDPRTAGTARPHTRTSPGRRPSARDRTRTRFTGGSGLRALRAAVEDET